MIKKIIIWGVVFEFITLWLVIVFLTLRPTLYDNKTQDNFYNAIDIGTRVKLLSVNNDY